MLDHPEDASTCKTCKKFRARRDFHLAQKEDHYMDRETVFISGISPSLRNSPPTFLFHFCGSLSLSLSLSLASSKIQKIYCHANKKVVDLDWIGWDGSYRYISFIIIIYR
jgi:hypothetical protein